MNNLSMALKNLEKKFFILRPLPAFCIICNYGLFCIYFILNEYSYA